MMIHVTSETQAMLFRLWQRHQLSLIISFPLPLMEQLVVSAHLEMDRATSAQVEEVLVLFNSLAGTHYNLEEVLSQQYICQGDAEQAGQVTLSAKRLWWLDFGNMDFPVYALSSEEAEYMTQVMEQSRKKPRLSLERQEQRRGGFAPLLLVCHFLVARMTRDIFEGLVGNEENGTSQAIIVLTQ